MKKYILPVFLFFICHSFAQIADSAKALNEIKIVSSREQYLVGSKILRFDSIKMNQVSADNLSEAISKFLPIYIKQDAGGLSTIRFRGTSPNHTAIMFNGINLNSNTLGHSNLASIPMFLFDEVKIQYGGSSSLYGSDAIGGSIHLVNQPLWNNEKSVGFQQEIGSFGSYFTGIKLKYSSKKIEYALKVFNQQKENNFPFLNTSVKDFQKNVFVHDTNRNSEIKNYGILQELFYKVSAKLYTYVKIWHENNWYQIQPNMSANYYGGSFDEILNKNTRVISGFEFNIRDTKIITDFGYVEDYQLYNNTFSQVIKVENLFLNANYQKSNFFGGSLNFGANISQLTPAVYAYKENIREQKADVFSSYKKLLFKRLNAALNLREALSSEFKSQFSPAFGLDYGLLRKTNYNLNWKYAISHSYKIPTFNDRYWLPNGNPNILPESGISNETGLVLNAAKKRTSMKFQVTGYLMNVDNWIQWVYQDVWRPVNVKNVRNRGIESSYELIFNIRKLVVNTALNYSFNQSIEIKSYDSASTSIGKQLSYAPKHLGNFNIGINYKTWNFTVMSAYTGTRFNDAGKELEDYILTNISLGKRLNLKKNSFVLSFKLNNIFDQLYQNQEFYAMPGRNYGINIKYQFTKK
ncbi:MAG: TonB-dependent receptor plug domain-containing protein [Bacteroidota bacterium]